MSWFFINVPGIPGNIWVQADSAAAAKSIARDFAAAEGVSYSSAEWDAIAAPSPSTVGDPTGANSGIQSGFAITGGIGGTIKNLGSGGTREWDQNAWGIGTQPPAGGGTGGGDVGDGGADDGTGPSLTEQISGLLGTPIGGTGYDAALDLNSDGVIDALDLSLATNGQTTPTPAPTAPTGEFNPQESIGASPFAQFALLESLKNAGIDTQQPGRGFFASLFPEVQNSEAFSSLLGLNQLNEGSTASPFANFIQNTIGAGGARGLGSASAQALSRIAGANPSESIGQLTPKQAEELGFRNAEGELVEGGDVLADVFQRPGSLDSRAGRGVSALASGALLNRLSPSAFNLFGDELVGAANRQFGNRVASGNSPSNYAAFLRHALRL